MANRISPVEVLYKHINSAVLQAAEEKNYFDCFLLCLREMAGIIGKEIRYMKLRRISEKLI